MRSSVLHSLALIALASWVVVAEYRARRLAAEIEELGPKLERLDQGYRDAAGASVRELEALEKTSGLTKAQLERELTRTNDLIAAYGKEMRERSVEDARRSADARAELATLRRRVVPDADTLQQRMLAPTVQLNGSDSVGSGTMVWSGRSSKTGENETYVLTAYHVVRNITRDATGEPHDRQHTDGQQTDSPHADRRQTGLQHTIFTRTGNVEVEGDLVISSERIDVALVKLRSSRTWAPVAHVVARPTARSVRITDPVYAAGCPLGNDPMLTRGEISALANEVKGSNYWMLTAPTYFGNSGGGVYLADTLELVGVFSKIYTAGQNARTVVTHMGLCTPIESVYEWLEREGYGFVLEGPQAEPAVDPSRFAGPEGVSSVSSVASGSSAR